ncbi:unnamed protein product, partial [Rotaria sp. Silwood2]
QPLQRHPLQNHPPQRPPLQHPLQRHHPLQHHPLRRSPLQRPPAQRPRLQHYPLQYPPLQRPPAQRPRLQHYPLQYPPLQRPPVQRLSLQYHPLQLHSVLHLLLEVAWTFTSYMNSIRYLHTASILNDGKVLVAGGYGYEGYSFWKSFNSSELYDPATGNWTKMGNMTIARYSHTASTLANGKVLVAGGYFYDGSSDRRYLNSSELYDPTTGIWTKTGNMNVARYYHTASILANGKVLVAGGFFYDGYNYWGPLNSAELYDPATETWTKAGNMTIGRYYHTACVLADGKVLVASGDGYDGYGNTVYLNSSELYDPATGIWTMTGNMNIGRKFHTASVLVNGKVLVAGGYFYDGRTYGQNLNSTELYDPTTGTWTMTGNMNIGRVDHTASVLINGQVLVTGGYIYDGYRYQDLYSAELYDPLTELWTKTNSMNVRREGHTASVLTSGKVLITGGYTGSGISSSAELYQ